MAMQITLTGPDGIQRAYALYSDILEIIRDFDSGKLANGEDFVYKQNLCYVLEGFNDEDGVRYAELIVTGSLGNNIQFSFNGGNFQL